MPIRQQTLRNTIAWSYELLDPVDARVFRALGAFGGVIRLSAAESILERTILRPGEAMDALQKLVALQESDLQAALAYNTSARDRFESASEDRGVAQCDANIGMLHYLLGDPETARTRLDRAAVGLSRFGDARFLIQVYSNLAALHLARGEYDLARDRALYLRELCQATANHRFEAMAWGIYAEVAVHNGAISESIAAIDRGKAIATGERFKVEDAYLSRVLGDAYVAAERLDDAAPHYAGAAAVFEEVGEQEELEKACEGL